MEIEKQCVVQPLWDYIIMELPQDSKARIIRIDTKDPTKVGTLELVVLFTGPDVRNVKPGDRLVFNPQAVVQFSYEDKSYFLIGERGIGAVVAPLREMKKVQSVKLPE